MSEPKPRILLVDDDPAMLRLIAAWLEKSGFEIECANNGQEAMQSIELDPPEMLITDWEMPGIDGVQLCRWVRDQNFSNYVFTIILSVRETADDVVRGFDEGADEFIHKPVSRRELLSRVKAGRRIIELERRLHRLAGQDSLTGLATQRVMYRNLHSEWSRSQRYRLPLSVVMLDIDFFKRVNDTYGHAAGDDVLRRVAESMSLSCRESDLLCRYGGEEFCAILPETTETNAALWADRVRESVAAKPIKIGDDTIDITASFGVAQMSTDTDCAEELVDCADQALLLAKRSGRNRVIPHSSLHEGAMPDVDVAPNAIFGDRRAADAMSTLVCYLKEDQPIIDAADYFLRYRVNSTPIINNENKIVGSLSEREVMSVMLQDDPSSVKISSLMKSNVISFEEDATLIAIFEFFSRVAVKSVVIVKDDRPQGLITRSSLMRFIRNSQASHWATPCKDEVCNKAARQVHQTAIALSQKAQDITAQLDGADDLLDSVIGGATQLQDLISDLLSQARTAEMCGKNSLPDSNGVQRGIAGLFDFADSDDSQWPT